jgi:hypothetical protein
MTPQLQAPETLTTSLLDRIVEERERLGARYMPTLTVKQFSERENLLRELKNMLVENVDYGVIPGTDKNKPTLLLPGAQKLCTFFGYVPHYEARQIEDWTGAERGEPLFYYDFTCVLKKDGEPVGEGRGSCNSWETKYRYRVGKRVCPTCGVAALIEGKQWKPSDPKEWVCFEKKGGCRAKFPIADERITSQQVGRVTNPDFADTINTVQKMGQKRAYIAATLSATGASQYFTQDLDEMVEIPSIPQPEPPPSNVPPVRTEGAPPNAGQTGESPTGGSSLPPEVAAIQARMIDRKTIGQELEILRQQLWELIGEPAQMEVDAIKEHYGDPFSKGGFAKRNALEIWKRIQYHAARLREPAPAHPAGLQSAKDLIDDSDLPKNLGGTFDPEAK